MFQRKSLISLFSLIGISLLSGCGFQPLYTAGSNGQVYETLQDVNVGVIPERRGQILRTYLLQDMQESSAAKYSLKVAMGETSRKLGFRRDKTPRHEEVILTAAISLFNEETGKVEYTDHLQAVASFSLGSMAEFASYSSDVAEDRAKDNALKVLAEDIKLSIATHLASQRVE